MGTTRDLYGDRWLWPGSKSGANKTWSRKLLRTPVWIAPTSIWNSKISRNIVALKVYRKCSGMASNKANLLVLGAVVFVSAIDTVVVVEEGGVVGILFASSLSQLSILNVSTWTLFSFFSRSFCSRCFARRGGSLLRRFESEPALLRLLLAAYNYVITSLCTSMTHYSTQNKVFPGVVWPGNQLATSTLHQLI